MAGEGDGTSGAGAAGVVGGKRGDNGGEDRHAEHSWQADDEHFEAHSMLLVSHQPSHATGGLDGEVAIDGEVGGDSRRAGGKLGGGATRKKGAYNSLRSRGASAPVTV